MRTLWSSFRMRLLVGSIAWTCGLLYIAHVASVFIVLGPQSWSRMTRAWIVLPGAVAAILLGFHIVRRSMASFAALRDRLVDVHEGRERQVTGTYFSEIDPVVDDLNALLAHRDVRLRQALAKAGDLAHGLKTPLAVLGHEADRLRAAGHLELATIVDQQVDRMRRHVEYHLVHARAAASGATPGTRCSVVESAAALARTLAQLYASRGLAIDLEVSADHFVRGQREDLDEVLGNLLDNACKWSRTRVAVASTNGNGCVAITVDDDGPGIAVAMRDAVLQRGVRADEAAPGSGFGLAIVRDLVELYGGSLALDVSPLGGLRARVRLPQA